MRKELDNDEFVLKDLDIQYNSIFDLEKELRNSSCNGAKYYRWYAQSIRKVADLELDLEIMSARLVDKICREENISNSARSEVRRSRIFLDDKFIKLKVKYNEALEEKEYLRGLVETWNAREYRIKELSRLSDRLLWNEPRVYDNRQNTTRSKADERYKLETE
jgi:hypothetical protein